MSVLEAFSYRLPCFITAACNLPAAFDQDAAIEIETNKDSIFAALSRLTSNDIDIDSYARNAASLAESYSWDRVETQLAEAYDWILGGGPTPEFVRKK